MRSVGHSHRSTTSSRKPGAAIEGTVRYLVPTLLDCAKCGGRRLDFGGEPGPHAPHWVERTGELVKVDCMGDVIA